ncbi:hypothetical protein D3C76_1310090 [compost metagenome]
MDCLRDWLSRLLRQPEHLYSEFRPPGLVPGAVQTGESTVAPVKTSIAAECTERGAGLLRAEHVGYLLAEHQSGRADRLRQRHFHHDLSAVHAGRVSITERTL